MQEVWEKFTSIVRSCVGSCIIAIARVVTTVIAKAASDIKLSGFGNASCEGFRSG